jgi:hypothetical protein
VDSIQKLVVGDGFVGGNVRCRTDISEWLLWKMRTFITERHSVRERDSAEWKLTVSSVKYCIIHNNLQL